jgi:hypothetical protein
MFKYKFNIVFVITICVFKKKILCVLNEKQIPIIPLKTENSKKIGTTKKF